MENNPSLLEREPLMRFVGGTFVSVEEMIATLKGQGHELSVFAEQTIRGDEFELLTEIRDVVLYAVTVGELTGKPCVTTETLYEAMHANGFCEAPDESAALVRLGYTDLGYQEWVTVLSEPRPGGDGNLCVLAVINDEDGTRIDVEFTDPDSDGWTSDCIVLVCRKPD